MNEITGRFTKLATQSMPRFHSPRRVDWTRASVIIGATVVFWSGMISIVPETWHHGVTVLLASVQSAVIFLMKSERSRLGMRTRVTDSQAVRKKKER